MVVNFHGNQIFVDFIRFLIHEVLYTWCLMYVSRLTVVSREAKKKQQAHMSSSLRDHYSELFSWMAALKFENAVTQSPSSFAYLHNYRPSML